MIMLHHHGSNGLANKDDPRISAGLGFSPKGGITMHSSVPSLPRNESQVPKDKNQVRPRFMS